MAKSNTKASIHSILIYPLIFIFSFILKGSKGKCENFFSSTLVKYNKLNILSIDIKEFSFLDKIKLFFDKNSLLYDKTHVSFDVDLEKIPEKKESGIFDFSKKIEMFYSASMLSSRVTNDNLLLSLTFDKNNLNDDDINIFLRYCLLVLASKKVDNLFIDKKTIKSEKIKNVYETLLKFLDNTKLVNFTKSKDLYVITCENKDEKFDIIWSSSNRQIELTDSHKVFDKFGEVVKSDVKISNSPIYAYHKKEL